MDIGIEKREVEFVYLMNCNSKSEMDLEINKKKKDGYELLQEHKIDTGYGIDYNARMMKIIK